MIIILLLLTITAHTLKPASLTESTFNQFSKNMDNIHHFIIHTQYVSSDLQQHFNHYQDSNDVFLYQCDPSTLSSCPQDKPLTLTINSLTIEFNGNISNEQDIKKWIQYKIDEHPNRLSSLDELKEYTRVKFQVFCFVDQNQPQTKEWIFVSLAKKYHFLYFCLIEEDYVKDINLKSGHLALIRRNMTFQTDEKSEQMAHDDPQLLLETWQNFIMKIFISDLRIDNPNPKASEIIFECDMSLDCQDDVSVLMRTEKVWRHHHESFAFKANIYRSTSGHNQKGQKYPLYSHIEKTTEERFEEINGETVRYVDVKKKKYQYSDPQVMQNTIEKFMRMIKNDEIEPTILDTETLVEKVDEVAVREQIPPAVDENFISPTTNKNEQL